MRCGKMKRFSLRFVDGTGREVERIVFANSKKEVLTRAGEKGIDLLSVDEKRTVSDCLTKSRYLSPEKLSFFFDQSARLTAAGIPFVKAWKLLAHDIKKREQQASLRACIAKMEGGERAAAAMEESGLFPRLACALVRAGEHSGRLDEMLRLSGDYYETAREQRAQVRRILIYPAFLFICIHLVFFGAVFFILPVFAELFAEMGTPLPAGTRMLLATGNFLCAYGPLLLGIFAATGVSIYCALQRRRYREEVEKLLCRVVRIRALCAIWSWQRFSLVMSVQMAGGIPILSAIRDSMSVIPLTTFQNHIARTARCLENGMSFSEAVRTGRFGTSYVETMLRVGETTGEYDTALRTISAYYGQQLREAAAMAQKITEPLMLVFVGIVTGALVLGLLLPLLDMVTAVGE